MSFDPGKIDLRLTDEEATALLGLCLSSPFALDAVSEKALRKLADYCARNSNSIGSSSIARSPNDDLNCEPVKAGV